MVYYSHLNAVHCGFYYVNGITLFCPIKGIQKVACAPQKVCSCCRSHTLSAYKKSRD